MTINEAKSKTPEEINRTISVALGIFDPDICLNNRNYFHDLNACHEAEKVFLLERNPHLSVRTRIGILKGYIVNGTSEIDLPPECAPAKIALAVVLSERK